MSVAASGIERKARSSAVITLVIRAAQGAGKR
jgi:hypothetical protein